MNVAGRKKIAIVGTGISGLTCGYYLHKEHDVTLFEANDYIGGHTATVDVSLNGKSTRSIPALLYTMTGLTQTSSK